MKERINLTEHGFCAAWDQNCFSTIDELARADLAHRIRVARGQEVCICDPIASLREPSWFQKLIWWFS
jgi:hypothetical protein